LFKEALINSLEADLR